MQKNNAPPLQPSDDTGLGWAAAIALAWAVSLWACLRVDLGQLPLAAVVALVIGRTFLQTGMFIVAHDAAHGTLCPARPAWNHRLGAIALLIYALLPYRRFARNHLRHHVSTATPSDPDFYAGDNTAHAGQPQPLVLWYWQFMRRYLDARQILVLLCWLTAIFHTLRLGFHVAIASLLLAWVLPMLFSSWQLFFFGTYLPHRLLPSGYPDDRRTHRSRWPVWASFLACYHFSYHWEHHAYPQLPWFRLPQARDRACSNRSVF